MRGSTALAVAIVIGALAAMLGAATVIGYGQHLIEVGHVGTDADVAGPVGAYVGGEALLVVAETIACAVFLALTCALIATRGHIAAPAAGVTVAVGKVVWLVASLVSSWKPGWYFILDPIGAHTTSRALIGASAAQAVALVAVAVQLVRGREKAP